MDDSVTVFVGLDSSESDRLSNGLPTLCTFSGGGDRDEEKERVSASLSNWLPGMLSTLASCWIDDGRRVSARLSRVLLSDEAFTGDLGTDLVGDGIRVSARSSKVPEAVAGATGTGSGDLGVVTVLDFTL